jgi:hypothetical protein
VGTVQDGRRVPFQSWADGGGRAAAVRRLRPPGGGGGRRRPPVAEAAAASGEAVAAGGGRPAAPVQRRVITRTPRRAARLLFGETRPTTPLVARGPPTAPAVTAEGASCAARAVPSDSVSCMLATRRVPTGRFADGVPGAGREKLSIRVSGGKSAISRNGDLEPLPNRQF